MLKDLVSILHIGIKELRFGYWIEFSAWKEKEEERTHTYYTTEKRYRPAANNEGTHTRTQIYEILVAITHQHTTGLSERVYLVCCRDGDYRPCKQPRLTEKRRPNQKGSRKLDDVCISRMYANVFDDGHVNVTYVTAHTNHKPGPPEDAYLPLPTSTRQEIALKLANGR